MINISYRSMKPGDVIYNLACDRIANYHRLRGDEVYSGPWRSLTLEHYDKFYFSIIFTWDVPRLIQVVQHVRKWAEGKLRWASWGKNVEIGGPAATFMTKYIYKETGLMPHCGLDERFEHIRGDFKATFSSRGCPHKCKWCGVKKVEPCAIEYDDFPLAPMLLDNSILATSWSHQQLVVEKFVEYKREIDINSGFDVRFFTPEHFELYSRLKLKQWRFAFDSMDVEPDVKRVGLFMKDKGFDRHKVTFYVLIGFPGQTPEECFYRLNTIIALGMNPYCMRYIPLNSLSHKYVAKGWTEELLQRMTVYYQTPNLWMTDSWDNYRQGKKIVEIPAEQIRGNL